MNKTIRTILIVVGVILLISFISATFKSCKENKKLKEREETFQADVQKLKDSLTYSKYLQDSIATSEVAKQRSVDSLASINAYISKDLLSSNDRAKKLLAENNRLKGIKDTSGLLANCDSLAEETQYLTRKVTEFKGQNDSLISSYKSLVQTNRDLISEKDRAYNKLDTGYKSLYLYNQTLYSELSKASKKARKTVSLSVSAGYGFGVPLNPVAIKPQPIIGITISKRLLNLW